MRWGPPGDVHSAIEGSDMEPPRHKVDIEEAIRIPEPMRRTLACSPQCLLSVLENSMCDPTSHCAFMLVTQSKGN